MTGDENHFGLGQSFFGFSRIPMPLCRSSIKSVMMRSKVSNSIRRTPSLPDVATWHWYPTRSSTRPRCAHGPRRCQRSRSECRRIRGRGRAFSSSGFFAGTHTIDDTRPLFARAGGTGVSRDSRTPNKSLRQAKSPNLRPVCEISAPVTIYRSEVFDFAFFMHGHARFSKDNEPRNATSGDRCRSLRRPINIVDGRLQHVTLRPWPKIVSVWDSLGWASTNTVIGRAIAAGYFIINLAAWTDFWR